MSKAKRPDGTADILPDQIPLWRKVEEIVRDTCARYGYLEVRPPMFEYTSLFYKSSGDTSDVVEKQMFTVPSRAQSEDSFTFRPELTPGTIRALVQGGLLQQRPLCKVFYMGPMFRYERPQKGRLRQFTQFGVEAVGSQDPLIDVETMALFADVLKAAGVKSYELNINTIGCRDCREKYRATLRAAIGDSLSRYCDNCRRRFDKNVLRIFDCKVEADVAMADKLPMITDSVCDACRSNFERVQAGLKDAKLAFTVNKRIVRGLDYYVRTVYEFTSSALGAQDALGGGGRYDGLVAQMGGPDVGAVGFAAGVERVLMAAGSMDVDLVKPDFFVVAAGEEARGPAFRIAQELRSAGLAGDLDFEAKSVKSQMRRANDLGARFCVIVGADELAKNVVKVKNMGDGSESAVPLDEARALIGRKA
jgi:histidyl-tRNA synthetase